MESIHINVLMYLMCYQLTSKIFDLDVETAKIYCIEMLINELIGLEIDHMLNGLLTRCVTHDEEDLISQELIEKDDWSQVTLAVETSHPS